MLNSIAFVLLASAQVITATALLPSFNARDVAPSDSLTYCSPIVAPSVPCTLTSSPISQVMFNMPGPASAGANNSYGAHFICYAQTSVGLRYLADHPASGQNPCWVTTSLLGPLNGCPNPVTGGKLCGCDFEQLVSCCELKGALGEDAVGGYIDDDYVPCGCYS